MSTLDVTCCGATVAPNWWTHDDGTVRGNWTCPTCGLCCQARSSSYEPVFARIEAAGLREVPLKVLEPAISQRLA